MTDFRCLDSFVKFQPKTSQNLSVAWKSQRKNWCVPFGTQRVETEGVSKNEDIEVYPKANSHPGTKQALSCLS